MPPITSLKNPHVQNAVRLRDRRHREKQGRTLIDGAGELHRGLDAGVQLAEAFVCEPLCQSDDARAVLDSLLHCGCEVWRVCESVFEKLAFGHRAEGVLGVAVTPDRKLKDLSIPADAVVAVLEGVEKPGNLGAVLRSADAAGIAAVLVADGRTDLFNPNAIRASLGTIFSVPVCATTSAEALVWLGERNFKIFCARVDGAVPYTEADLRGPAARVLGREAAGLTHGWPGPAGQAVRLPMLGAADSLNVSVTAAVLFYEALRQKAKPRDAQAGEPGGGVKSY